MKEIRSNEQGFSNLVPIVLAVVITFALLFVGVYITGTIHEKLDTSGSTSTQARATMNTTATNFDSAIGIVQVVIIITILASAIGAIFLFTRVQ